ncbi:hypothetical protein ASPSYDRAFT_60196 [Aspergillus sydowii CBS 593.65]|uniref:Cupin type-1 domain-containing protein n=1 Tax=Aspergillus sydowii CBS 593.65 TaxID=1036612 RepID=A0A1L9T9H7_9EURO|nr:uncharacterized protein ASPSYDRAFT_60196 [Aspergillus sydowii CBS 593.65]OJJ56087.1 hypothetical protein ASPSYDRAFT_60196 [Aspergillus sydowii CBS 593.65]
MSTSKIAASDIKVVKAGDTYQVEGRPREEFTILNIFHPPNLPGKQIVVVKLWYSPNAASPPHTHSGATIVGVVTEGTVLNQMNDDDPGPGCHHVRSENNTQERASFVAVLIIDDEVVKEGYHKIFVLDAENEAK